MKTGVIKNQIVITTDDKNGKQKLPMNLVVFFVAGTIAGMVVIFTLFWGAEILLGR